MFALCRISSTCCDDANMFCSYTTSSSEDFLALMSPLFEYVLFISLASSMKLLLTWLRDLCGPIEWSSSTLAKKVRWCFDWMSKFIFFKNLFVSFKALFSSSSSRLLSFRSSICDSRKPILMFSFFWVMFYSFTMCWSSAMRAVASF